MMKSVYTCGMNQYIYGFYLPDEVIPKTKSFYRYEMKSISDISLQYLGIYLSIYQQSRSRTMAAVMKVACPAGWYTHIHTST